MISAQTTYVMEHVIEELWHFWIPDPHNLWGKWNGCFMQLSFGVVGYAAIDNWSTHPTRLPGFISWVVTVWHIFIRSWLYKPPGPIKICHIIVRFFSIQDRYGKLANQLTDTYWTETHGERPQTKLFRNFIVCLEGCVTVIFHIAVTPYHHL